MNTTYKHMSRGMWLSKYEGDTLFVCINLNQTNTLDYTVNEVA